MYPTPLHGQHTHRERIESNTRVCVYRFYLRLEPYARGTTAGYSCIYIALKRVGLYEITKKKYIHISLQISGLGYQTRKRP